MCVHTHTHTDIHSVWSIVLNGDLARVRYPGLLPTCMFHNPVPFRTWCAWNGRSAAVAPRRESPPRCSWGLLPGWLATLGSARLQSWTGRGRPPLPGTWRNTQSNGRWRRTGTINSLGKPGLRDHSLLSQVGSPDVNENGGYICQSFDERKSNKKHRRRDDTRQAYLQNLVAVYKAATCTLRTLVCKCTDIPCSKTEQGIIFVMSI